MKINVGSGESLGEGEEDWARIEFKMLTNNVEKSAIYSFTINELESLNKEKIHLHV